MAQQSCPGCGSVIATDAHVCPQCGHVLRQAPVPRKRPVWLWVVIALIAILLAAPYVWRIIQGVEEAQAPGGVVDPAPSSQPATPEP